MAKTVTAIIAAAALACSLLYISRQSAPPQVKQEETYVSWQRKNVLPLISQKGFTHPAFMQPYTPTEQEVSMLASIVQGENPGCDIKPFEFSKGTGFTSIDITSGGLDRYSERMHNEIEEVFRYTGIDNPPAITFYRLTHETKLEPPSTGSIPLYLVSKRLKSTVGKFKVSRGGGQYVRAARISTELPGAEMVGGLLYDFTVGKVTVKGTVSPIIISLEEAPLNTYTGPIAEILHYTFHPSVLHALEERMNKEWIRAGSPPSTTTHLIARANLLTQESLRWDEGVVHAIIIGYLEANKNRLGFSDAEIRDYMHGFTHPDESLPDRYSHIPLAHTFLMCHGPHQLVQTYQKNAQKIFERREE